VTRHDWSFCRQVIATQTATDRQAGSFGQLVAPEQQLFWTQVAHDDAAALKMAVAPGQLPASGTAPVWAGGAPASRAGDELPPMGVAPLQGALLVETHFPSCGGLGPDEEEQARSAAIAPAAADQRKDELFEAMAICFLGLRSRRLSRVMRVNERGRGHFAHGPAHFPSDRGHGSSLALEGSRLDRL
jgi:hypothetical protein